MSEPVFRQKLEAAMATLEREGHREVSQVLRQLVEAHTVETWNHALEEATGWLRARAGAAPTFEHLPREERLGAAVHFLSNGMESALRRSYQEQVHPRAPGMYLLPREHEAILTVVRRLEQHMPLAQSAPQATHAKLLERLLARSPVTGAEARTLGGWLRQLAQATATASLRARLEAAAASMDQAPGAA